MKTVKNMKIKASTSLNDNDYDLNSTSGRAKICRDVSKLFIEKHAREGQHIKSISGRLMIYNKGIYEDSEEERSFMKKEIRDIGESLNIIMPTSLIDQSLKLVELDTLDRFADCEPDIDHVIVLNNGVLDLITWKFSDFSPDKVYFSKIPIDYNPNAAAPTIFLRFIDTCFEGNEAQKDLIQESFGYTLTKNYKYQDVFYCIGEGGNGKGSAMSILRLLLGDHNCTSFSLYQLSDGEHVDYNIAEMHGKHVNICGDVGTKKVINTENLKKLSSNTDPVQGRRVRERPFQFLNYAKMFFLMNRAPQTDAHTTGDQRRIRTINFVNSFAEKKNEIKDIHKVIKDAGELPGVLLWAIEGLKRLEKNNGFTDARSIIQRSLEYDKKSDTMRYFVEECIEESIGSMVPREILLEAYRNFTKKVGGAQIGIKEFKKEFLNECKDAGWNSARCKQDRPKVLGPDTENVLRNDYGITGEKVHIFYDVSIIQEEPQKTIKEFMPTVSAKLNVCTTDAEAYEAITRD